MGERLGRVIERKLATQSQRDSEKRFRNLVDDALIGISIIQDDKAIYRNPEQKKILGSMPMIFSPAGEKYIHPEDLAH